MNLSEKSIYPKNRTRLKVILPTGSGRLPTYHCQIGNDQIQAMTKYDLKVLVKKITEQASFSRLMAIKDTKKKLKWTIQVT